MATQFARTGVGREWLHTFARQRVGRILVIAEAAVIVFALVVLRLGLWGFEPSLRRAVTATIGGIIHLASCWVAWRFGLLERSNTDPYANGRTRSKLQQIAVGSVILISSQVLAVDLYARTPGSERFNIVASAFLVTCAVMFTSAVFSLLFSARNAGVVPAIVTGLTVATQWAFGMEIHLPIIAAAFVAAYLLVLKLQLTDWHESLWREWEADLDLLAALAASQERLSISRDLHDTTGQSLTVIALKTEIAQRYLEQGNPAAIKEIREVRRLAQKTLEETRRLAHTYRETNLAAEIVSARSLLEAANIRFRIRGTAAGLPGAVDSVFGWVLREASTNITRHSSASEVNVELGRAGGMATMTVRNDGLQVTRTQGSSSSGSGLQGLRERLAAVGGTLATSAEGSRFVLSVSALVQATVPSGREN